MIIQNVQLVSTRFQDKMLVRAFLSLLFFVVPGEFRIHIKLWTFLFWNKTVLSQAGGQYVDPDNGIPFWGYTEPVHGMTFGYIFPPLDSTGSLANEFIGEIVAPLDAKWAGVSPGGQMLENLLLTVWPNGNSIVRSARYATWVISWLQFERICRLTQRQWLCTAIVRVDFSLLSNNLMSNCRLMSGPILTDLPSTKVNSTHWKWVYRCENCISEQPI